MKVYANFPNLLGQLADARVEASANGRTLLVLESGHNAPLSRVLARLAQVRIVDATDAEREALRAAGYEIEGL